MIAKSSSGAQLSIVKVLAIVILLGCVNAASAASTPKGANSQPLALNFERSDASTQRFLRTAVVEERRLAINLPGFGQAVSGTKSWAANLLQQLQQKWSQRRLKSPNDMFKKLKLHQTGGKLFESPSFSKWVTYVTTNSKDTPEMAIFSTLAYHYSDEALAKMLAVAKNIDSTKALAKKLEGIQFTNWVHARESPDYVFKVLALNQMGTKTFASPQFSRWTEFLTKVNTKNPNVAIYATLGTYYSDDVLARMFAAAKQVDSSKTLATKLERIQLMNWDNAGKSAESVFKTLKLDKTGDKLFESRVVNTWASYVTNTHKDPDAIMLALLKEKYRDETLAKMIAAATKVESTENLATGLRSVQFKTWFSQGKTPEHVNTLLNVAANSDDLTKKVSRDYDIFYGKIKVTDTGARPASRPARKV